MKFLDSFKYIIFLFFFAVVSHLVWFDFSSTLSSSDWGYWTEEASRQLYYSYGTWITVFEFGRVNIQIYFNLFKLIWSLIANLGFSYDDATKITFLIPIAVLGFISPFFLIKKITKNEMVAFIAAIFYGSTTHFLVRQTAHMPIAFVYALFPLIFYFFIKAFEKNKKHNWFILIFIYQIALCYEIRITLVATFVLFIYFLIFYFESLAKYWINIIILIFILFFLNLFWLFPSLLAGTTESISAVANRGLFGNSLFDLGHALALSESAWTGGLLNSQFVKQPILWYLWLIPIIIFQVFIFKAKNFKYKKGIIFFAIVAFLGIFLTKQSENPFPDIYLWLYKNFPGFNLFREASKFYLLTAIGYLGLMGYGLAILKENKDSIFNKYLFYIFSFVVVLVSFTNLKPLANGDIKTMFISKEIPKEYIFLKSFVSNQKNYFRTFYIPATSRWGFFANENPKISGISTLSSSWKNIYNPNRSRFGQPINEQLLNLLKWSFSDSLFNISSIKYIIVPIQDIANDDDFFINYGGKENPNIRQWYIDEMDKISWLKKIDIGTTELVIYENENYKPPIFAFNSLLKFNAISNLEEKYNFVVKDLKKDFYFVSGEDGLESRKTLTVNNIFENITPVNLENSKIRVDLREVSGEKLIYLKEPAGRLLLNGQSIDFDGGVWEKAVDLTDGGNVFEYENENFNYKNIIQNGSFENGTWSDKVGDCHNYDENPILKMSLNKEDKTEGEQSLQLEATRHTACVSTKLPVKENSSYLVSFDYQSPNSKIASYYLAFDDEEKTVFSENLDLKDRSWQNFSKVIKAPAGATKLSLYVYAKQSDGKDNVINRYDNFKLVEVPDLSDAFYLVDKEERKLEEPKSVDFDLINPTKKLVHIRGAKTPFYLAMSESFHPQWQLQMNNEKIQGYLNKWWPFVKPDRVSDENHYKLDDFLNAWYVDPAEMCAKNSACVKHSDGSYDMEMTLEFFPQRWFYFGLIISGTTLLGCISYLVWVGRKSIGNFFRKIVNFVGGRKKKKEKEKNKLE